MIFFIPIRISMEDNLSEADEVKLEAIIINRRYN